MNLSATTTGKVSTKERVKLNTFADSRELDAALAREVAQALRDAVAVQGHASLAVSGGKTPVGFLQCLSREQLPWDKVTVTLVDERWVDESSGDSNTRLVRDNLLCNAAQAARFIGLKTATASPFTALMEVEQRMMALPLPLTVAVLGMGLDGHTASFFPNTDTLSSALSPSHHEKVAAVQPLNAAHERITLTLPLLLNARSLILHIVGEEKMRVLQIAMQPGAVESMPVRAVLQGRTQDLNPLEVYYTASEAN